MGFWDWLKSLFVKSEMMPIPKPPVYVPNNPPKQPEPAQLKASGENDYLARALKYTFVNEGGYSDHASDRGGATSRYGVTIGELARWRKHPVSKLDVRNMSEQEATDIYESWYWRPLGCHKIIHPGIAIAIFDIGIVRGIGVPPKYMQQICNAHGAGLVVDGHVGPKTIAAVNALDQALFVKDFAAKARNGFLGIVAGRPSQAVFIKGWLNRAKRLLTLAKEV